MSTEGNVIALLRQGVRGCSLLIQFEGFSAKTETLMGKDQQVGIP